MEKNPSTLRYDLYPWLYDRVVDDSKSGDLEWYRSYCKRSGDPVLELGCGTGRVSVPLAMDGLEVVGLDQSPSMLDRARACAREEMVEDRLHFVQDEMESFSLQQRFQTIIIPFGSFAHLVTPAQQGSCLERIHQHLASDGRFVLDVKRFNPEPFDDGYREWPYTDFYSAPNQEIEVRRKIKAWYNEEESRIDYVFLFEERPSGADGEIKQRKTHHALSTIADVELLTVLRGAGFQLETIHGNHRGKPFEPGDPWCCVIARSDRRSR